MKKYNITMNELDVAQQTALKVGKLLLEAFHKPKIITTKTTETDIVTKSDIASQKLIKDEITKYFPGHSIIGEEDLRVEKGSKYTWYIDPLDGTVSFAHGYPMFSVSIGLKKDNEALLGVVYAPVMDELFCAVKNKGAFLNGKRIHVSTTPTLMQSILATGFPYHKHINSDNNIKEFCRVIVNIQGIRRTGSAALDLCYVAAGRLDGYWELFINTWDYTAGALIVQEAGGIVTDTDGLPLDFIGSRVVATNRKIHKQLLVALKYSETTKLQKKKW